MDAELLQYFNNTSIEQRMAIYESRYAPRRTPPVDKILRDATEALELKGVPGRITPKQAIDTFRKL